jgi:hypothetical protein
MRHLKKPPAQICARLALAEVTKQREEDLLRDFLGVRHAKSK